MSLNRSDYHYQLPEELIAKYPSEQRDGSRMLLMDIDTGQHADRMFVDFAELINNDDLLVFNNTRVIPARIFGEKDTGGKVEVLVERVLSDKQCLAHVKASKRPKPGSKIYVISYAAEQPAAVFSVVEPQGDLLLLTLEGDVALLALLDQIGHMPLPPYIDRKDATLDRERYQTVYGKHAGAVAAPTAGLHFSELFLQQLKERGVEFGFVTLHVGAGTFQPVRSDSISDHKMHSEYLEVNETLCEQVRRCKARGGRVIAIGTTSVRCLETASANGRIEPYEGETDIFIYPGYQFRCIDALLTNFHLSESTLIMLVSALAGRDQVLQAYNHAVESRYRFFSYGDAMFLSKGLFN